MTNYDDIIPPGQLRMLGLIQQLTQKHRYPPNIRELMQAAGFCSPHSVKCHLIPLRRKGLVAWEKVETPGRGPARTLRSLVRIEIFPQGVTP